MKTRCAAAILVALATALPAVASGTELQTDEQKALYALGLTMSRRLTPFNLTEADLVYVHAGLLDGALGRQPRVDMAVFGPKIDELAKSRVATMAAAEKKSAEEFLAKTAAEPGVTKTPSGLLYKELTPGTGDSPAPTDIVKVHYRGTLTNGTQFDSSLDRGQPAEFGLNQVIRCWTEGVQMMKAGGKSRLICPSDIAYGDRGAPPDIKPGATLVFEVELLEVKKPAPAPAAPAAPPAPPTPPTPPPSPK